MRQDLCSQILTRMDVFTSSPLESFASVSQYIFITHNKKTVMGAGTMLGITMEESGVSKIIALRLDAEIQRGYQETPNERFVEEDVPDEEGVVLPPRPPKREHTEETSEDKPQE